MKALVSGAGIAGPTVAYWLAREGVDVTVVERAAAPRRGGYAVDIRGVALEVVERMGLRDALRPFETDTLSNSIVDAEGRRFGRMERGFGVIDPNDVEILRGDLASILYEVSRRGAEHRFGDEVVAIEPAGKALDVTFASGGTERFDLVIGADGVHSRVRGLTFGPEHDVMRHLGSIMTIYTMPNVLGLRREQLLWNGVDRIASVKSASNDSELKVSLFFAAKPDAFDPRDVDAQRRATAAAFVDQGWEFRRLLDGMWGADDFYADLTCQVRMEHFQRGRVALVGDAGYGPSPLSGQGTSLALVGAYVLAHELGASGLDPEVALPRYEARVRDFVVRNQDIALKIAGGFAPRSAFELWSRNLVMKALPYVPGTGMMMSLAMRGVRDAARAMTLPGA